MKTKSVSIFDFKGHPHPASRLFRSIELKTVHENCKKITFNHPSLDIGCGDGFMTSILFDDKFTYGIDNGEAKDVAIAIKNKRYKKVFIESAEKMSLKSDSINFAFCNSVIEHIPNVEAVLSETARILKKGGVFVFTSPSPHFRKFLFFTTQLRKLGLGFLGDLYSKKRNEMLNHYHLYSHREWGRRLKKYGLEIKKFQYYISKECLEFWDRIALEVRFRKLVDKNAEKNLFKKYKNQIEFYFQNDNVKNDQGASLFIYAVKK